MSLTIHLDVSFIFKTLSN